MLQQLSTMLTMQDRMNRRVHPDWINQQFAWHRALWIECGELIEHYGYKWWKQQSPDMEQVQLEVVDIWHFGLSMRLDGRPVEVVAKELADEVAAQTLPLQGVLHAAEELATVTLAERRFSLPHFWALMAATELSFEQLFAAYVGKNVLNFFRQDHGYKEGSYQKLWQGREDNEHLVELVAELDSTATDFAELLYQALQQRYQALTA